MVSVLVHGLGFIGLVFSPLQLLSLSFILAAPTFRTSRLRILFLLDPQILINGSIEVVLLGSVVTCWGLTFKPVYVYLLNFVEEDLRAWL